jgi:hypothetical protein
MGLCLCTPPPLQTESSGDLFDSLKHQRTPDAVTAFGDAEISINGERHSCSIETKWKKNGFQTDFYGPLGMVVASIHADSLQGTATVRDKEYSFAVNRTMDTLPFSWASDLTFGDFERVMIGVLPSAIFPKLNDRPDTISREKKAIFTLWKTDSLEMRVKIGVRSQKIESVSVAFKKRTPFWYLTMAAPQQGIFRKIELRENDTNYFIIKYLKVNIR